MACKYRSRNTGPPVCGQPPGASQPTEVGCPRLEQARIHRDEPPLTPVARGPLPPAGSEPERKPYRSPGACDHAGGTEEI